MAKAHPWPEMRVVSDEDPDPTSARRDSDTPHIESLHIKSLHIEFYTSNLYTSKPRIAEEIASSRNGCGACGIIWGYIVDHHGCVSGEGNQCVSVYKGRNINVGIVLEGLRLGDWGHFECSSLV